MPRISILLTSYNHEKWLREAIESALNQTFQDFELIIWDDASTDRSWDIIGSYDDPRIRAFRNEQNVRGAYNMLKAISEVASGEYIAIHHSDDIWEADKLEKQVHILDARPELGAVFTWANVIDDEGKTVDGHFLQGIFAQPNKTRHEWLRYFLLRGNALCHPSILIRKQCYQDCGLYRQGLYQLPDFDMWVRLCLKYEIHVIPEALVGFRWHDDASNASTLNSETMNRYHFEEYLILENYRRIDQIDDVLKMLPWATKYLGSNGSDPGYVLARALLDIAPCGSTRLFAQKILFDFISSPEQATRIRALHGFGSVDLREITKQGVIFDESVQTAVTPATSPPPAFKLGVQAFEAMNYPAALEHLSTAMHLEPANPLPIAYLAFVAVRQGLVSEACDFIAQCQKIAPERHDIMVAFGEILLEAGHAERAIDYLHTALSARHDLFTAYPALARALQQVGKLEEAIQLLQAAIAIDGNPQQDTIQALLNELVTEKNLSHSGENHPLVSVIIPAYNHEQYIGAAIESVLNQSLSDKTGQPRFDTLHARGIQAFKAGNYSTALDCLSEAMSLEPKNPGPPAYLAFICAKQGLFQEAENLFGTALALAPNHATLQISWGEILLEVGKPELARMHLEQAVAAQPDLYFAYPALAQSLALTGDADEGVALLQSIAGMEIPEQENIRSALLKLSIQQGNLEAFAAYWLRFSQTLDGDLLAVRGFAQCDMQGEQLLQACSRLQTRLAESIQALLAGRPDMAAPPPRRIGKAPRKIAFLIGDFAREKRLGRLVPLLQWLPQEQFITQLVVQAGPISQDDDQGLCALLADVCVDIRALKNDAALQKIAQIAPDILVNLEAYAPTDRLALFTAAPVAEKYLWCEAPLPPLEANVRVLAGAALRVETELPTLTLPGLGECWDLPDLPLETVSRASSAPVFGCLTPAAQVNEAGWNLFAALLRAQPESRIVLNLRDLGAEARAFIAARFARAGVAVERLDFLNLADTAEALLQAWRDIDLGLASPAGAGALDLPTCLWMGKPYLALASSLPWSRRPAALLEVAGAAEWIAHTPEDFVALAQKCPTAPNPEFRSRLKAAGLTDPHAFARNVAAALLTQESRT
jgi:glycosyltransferase involved in cell wall biosynthesis/Flp pilus assembly protein TadD